MNNTFAVRPRAAKDYGVYVCNARNGIGSTPYQIILSEGQKISAAVNRIEGENSA